MILQTFKHALRLHLRAMRWRKLTLQLQAVWAWPMLQDKCPGRLVWVLRQMEPEVWFNNQGINYSVQLKAPGMESITDKVNFKLAGAYTLQGVGETKCHGQAMS